MLVAMAGLPGTGKSALAARLQERLGAVVLDKDRVRAALFPPRVLDYSAAQDGIAMAAVYQAAAAILRADPRRAVVLDGRTFLRAGQLDDLLARAASVPHLEVVAVGCRDAVQVVGLPGRHPPLGKAEGLVAGLPPLFSSPRARSRGVRR